MVFYVVLHCLVIHQPALMVAHTILTDVQTIDRLISNESNL